MKKLKKIKKNIKVNKKRKKLKKGFTLAELVTIIIIIGIIALIAIPTVNVQVKNSRRNVFKITCDKIFDLDEKYQLVKELVSDETECVIFDFDKDIKERQEIDGEVYEPVKLLGLDNTSDITGQYKLCKGKSLIINNNEFTCVYDANNKKLLDSRELVNIPVLSSIEVIPRDTQITVIVHTESEVKNYYYKLDNNEYEKSNENTKIISGLTPETDYTVTVYIEDEHGIKSNEIIAHTTTAVGYTGVSNNEYEVGDIISYSGVEFEVVKDNGDTVTLISKYNVKVDKFGNTSSWNDSTAKGYLNNEWLSDKETIATDIEKGAVIYDSTSNSYIRMIKVEELSSELKNYSNTPFWTMTNIENNVYYALKNANSQYNKYNLTQDVNKTIYLGSANTLQGITNNYQINNVTETTESLNSDPTKTQVITGNTKTKETLGTGYDSYRVSQVEENYSCNCVEEPCNCQDYSCNTTQTTTSVVYGSYCTGDRCAGDVCDWSTCTGNVCNGYASTSCGRYSCGKYSSQYTSCNTYSYSAPGCRNGVKCMTTTQCGPSWSTWNKYCTNYCQAGCTNEVCGGSACAGWRCTAYVCNGYSTTVKSTDTRYNTITSTCTECNSTCETCETCTRDVDLYEATGKQITCERYTVSDATDVIGIRAVLTVKKQRSNN